MRNVISARKMTRFKFKAQPRVRKQEINEKVALYAGAVAMLITLPLGPFAFLPAGMVTYIIIRARFNRKQ